MKYIITFLAFLALVISCTTDRKTNFLSNPDDMIADEYIINIDRDTTLVTKNGALLKIPKGSLTTNEGNTVTLEIKEAYSIQQMILAGLTTQSNGEPLSSGGMIYINAAAGQKVTIKQAIKAATPANYLANNMQLFKGDQTEEGTINWNNPVVLPENKQVNQIEQGRILFQSKCASCHHIGEEATGPDLANILKRPYIDAEDSYPNFHFGISTHSAGSFSAVDSSERYYHYSSSGLYNCNVWKRFGSIAPSFPDLTYEDIFGIYKYVQNESNEKGLPMPAHAYLDSCIDSCRLYKERVGSLQYQKQAVELERKGLIEDNGPLVDIRPGPVQSDPIIPSPNTETFNPPVDFEEKVSPQNYDAVYYQFTIESFGWFNIDVLLKDVNGVKESELFVRIIGEYREKIKVFLIIPSVKVYGEGGLAERSPNEFAFFYKNGKLPLPQNAKAYIMAVTETESSIAFALKEFTTERQQQFDISLKAATKEQFRSAIQNINLDRLYIGVSDSKNAGTIRQTDSVIKNIDAEIKKVESLKPKGCDCDCGQLIFGPPNTIALDSTAK